jgi:glycosyltransferase involved in cell wall biosynthesis
MADHRPRVAMLVSNRDVVHDNRVRREARSVARLGYDVHVLAHTRSDVPEEEAGGPRYTAIRWSLAPSSSDAKSVEAERAAAYGAAKRRGRTLPLVIAGVRLAAARARLAAARRAGELVAHRWTSASARRVIYWRRVKPLLAALQPDLVHAHDLKTLYAARRHHARTGTPFIYDAHELEVHSVSVRSPLDRGLAWVFECYGIKHAAAVITVSDGIAVEIARIHSVPKPHVVFNAPSYETVAAAPAYALRERCGLEPSDRLLVYVGGVNAARGTSLLVDALATLPAAFQLAIVGPRVPVPDRELLERAASAGVETRLHLLPPVPGDALPATIAVADISVLPGIAGCRSYELAMPNKLFESVMAGVPVAVSRARPDQVRFVREHEIGTDFDVRDPESLAAAARSLIATRPPGLIDAARLDALRRRFSWETQEQTLAGVYATVRS